MIKIILIMLMLVLPVNSRSGELGRLFMTAEQRQQLEHPAIDSQVQAQPSVLYLNGFVRQRRGRKTIWVNQHDLQSVPASPGITVQPYVTRRYQVPVEAKGQHFLLKPGQRLTLETRQIEDVFQPIQQQSSDGEKGDAEVSSVPADKASSGAEDTDVKALVSKYGPAPVLNAVKQ